MKDDKRKLKIFLITQADPFYLGKNIRYFLESLPEDILVTGCLISPVSPFGKKETFSKKAFKTLQVFGLYFFLRYAFRYLIALLRSKDSVENVVKQFGFPIVSLVGSINSLETISKIRETDPDVLISIGGNEIFRSALINLARFGCLNLHTAELPKYRGLMPSFWVLKNQEESTAVSVFFVDEGIDSGPIFVQRKIDISEQSLDQLIEQTKRLGMDCLLEALRKISLGDLKTIPNDNEKMSYYSFPTKNDVRDFKKARKRFY